VIILKRSRYLIQVGVSMLTTGTFKSFRHFVGNRRNRNKGVAPLSEVINHSYTLRSYTYSIILINGGLFNRRSCYIKLTVIPIRTNMTAKQGFSTHSFGFMISSLERHTNVKCWTWEKCQKEIFNFKFWLEIAHGDENNRDMFP